jgi:hypothetical protein
LRESDKHSHENIYTTNIVWQTISNRIKRYITDSPSTLIKLEIANYGQTASVLCHIKTQSLVNGRVKNHSTCLILYYVSTSCGVAMSKRKLVWGIKVTFYQMATLRAKIRRSHKNI